MTSVAHHVLTDANGVILHVEIHYEAPYLTVSVFFGNCYEFLKLLSTVFPQNMDLLIQQRPIAREFFVPSAFGWIPGHIEPFHVSHELFEGDFHAPGWKARTQGGCA